MLWVSSIIRIKVSIKNLIRFVTKKNSNLLYAYLKDGKLPACHVTYNGNKEVGNIFNKFKKVFCNLFMNIVKLFVTLDSWVINLLSRNQEWGAKQFGGSSDLTTSKGCWAWPQSDKYCCIDTTSRLWNHGKENSALVIETIAVLQYSGLVINRAPVYAMLSRYSLSSRLTFFAVFGQNSIHWFGNRCRIISN